jgi:hypothetical protein
MRRVADPKKRQQLRGNAERDRRAKLLQACWGRHRRSVFSFHGSAEDFAKVRGSFASVVHVIRSDIGLRDGGRSAEGGGAGWADVRGGRAGTGRRRAGSGKRPTPGAMIKKIRPAVCDAGLIHTEDDRCDKSHACLQ